MCGIAGIYSFTEQGNSFLDYTPKAIESLKHRGPDSSGVFNEDSISLGHTRLSIIDTSEAANQPFLDISGRYVIVYNGEFYNYKKYREELITQGVKFKSNSDTEVLLHLYIRYGAACVEKVNGFFAFAIYDKQEKTLFIARDRMGIKPLLYYKDDDKLIFASEMKAILAYGIEKKIDKASLLSYFQLNYIPEPYSIFLGVRKIPAGGYLLINKNKIEHRQYYQVPKYKNHKTSYSYENAKGELRNHLDESVKSRLVSDVPLGTFLSGGIDSSVITSIASRYKSDLQTFSIGYKDEPLFDETQYANLVAKKYNTNHTVFSLSNTDLYEDLDNILNYLDEPFADSSAIAVYILSKKVKEKVTVILSGDGADELFSGYNKHKAEYLARNANFLERSVGWSYPIFKNFPQSRNSRLGNFIRQLNRFGEGLNKGNKSRYWDWASFTTYFSAKKVFKEEFLESSSVERYKKRKDIILKGISDNGDLNDVLYTDVDLVLKGDMLRKVDSMSMANSLEVRTPFLDHNVVDFSFSLPEEYKITRSMKKKILQETYRNDLPLELFNRPKHGFEVPLLKWFQTDLKSTIEDNLLADEFVESQGIFELTEIQKLKKRLQSSNPGDITSLVWALIVFQSWWKKYYLN